ncbi:MAG: cytochrome c [Polyangiales bacterium]
MRGAWLVLGLSAIAVVFTLLRAQTRLTRRYTPALSVLPAAVSGDAVRGEHLSYTYGCRHCHGEDLGGAVMSDDVLMRVVAPNITPGSPLVQVYRLQDWQRAIWHGVARDGRPLLIMPSDHLRGLSDADLTALTSHLTTAPSVERELPPTEVRVLGRILLGSGAPLLAAETIDHTRPRPPLAAPAPNVSVAYGAYVARTCEGCHGIDHRGGPPVGPPGTPAPPDISSAALRQWTQGEFVRALREGKKRDGSALDEMMPWQSFKHLTDDELEALWMAMTHG